MSSDGSHRFESPGDSRRTYDLLVNGAITRGIVSPCGRLIVSGSRRIFRFLSCERSVERIRSDTLVLGVKRQYRRIGAVPLIAVEYRILPCPRQPGRYDSISRSVTNGTDQKRAMGEQSLKRELGFVSGHDFSRAGKGPTKDRGF
jgi:hypothetical protein